MGHRNGGGTVSPPTAVSPVVQASTRALSDPNSSFPPSRWASPGSNDPADPVRAGTSGEQLRSCSGDPTLGSLELGDTPFKDPVPNLKARNALIIFVKPRLFFIYNPKSAQKIILAGQLTLAALYGTEERSRTAARPPYAIRHNGLFQSDTYGDLQRT